MTRFGILRVLMGALLPAALAAQQPPQPPQSVEPQQLWKLDTGG